MTTFPSPWTRDELVLTRWPGPVTIRYRSVACRAEGMHRAWTRVWKCWQAEDPELAEEHGLPVRAGVEEEWEAKRAGHGWTSVGPATGPPLIDFFFPLTPGLTTYNNPATLPAQPKETPHE